MSYVIQGSCNDLFSYIWRRLRENKKIKIKAKIHDEFLVVSPLTLKELKEYADSISFSYRGVKFPLRVERT